MYVSVKRKKNIIKSRHIRVNCVHFQSQHGLVFAQFFSFFSLLLSCYCRHSQLWPQIRGDTSEGRKKIGPHMQVFFVIVEAETQCGSRALVPFGSLFLTFLTFLHYLSCLHSNSILHLKQHNNLFRYYF